MAVRVNASTYLERVWLEPPPADVANALSRFVPVYLCSLLRWWPQVEIGAILRGLLVVAENRRSADRLRRHRKVCS